MSDIAYNPKTGDAVRLQGGQWVPAEVARNPKTGEAAIFDGASWKVIGRQPSSADPNIARIERNVRKMIDQSAPEADIDAYLGGEGHTPDSFKGAMQSAKQPTRSPRDIEVALPDGRKVAFPEGTPRETMERALQEYWARTNKSVPAPGTIQDGYRFKGGDPADPASWQPMPKVGEAVDGYRFKGGDPGRKENWVEIGTTERVQRGVGLTAQGFNDAVSGTLGLPVDLVNRGLSVAGLGSERPIGGSQMFRDALDYIGSRGAKALGYGDARRITPETTGEKFIYGGARGVGDAVAMLTGAGAIKAAAAPGGLTTRVAGALTESPLTQVVASGVGSSVGEATDSPIAGIGTSLAVGMTPSLLRAAAAPQVGKLTAEQQRLAQVLAKEGVPLTTGQATGSRPIQYLESALANLPVSGGMAQRQNQQQLSKLTEAVVKRAGMSGDDASDAARLAQRATLGRGMDDITSRATLRLDDDFYGTLDKLVARYEAKLPTDQKAIFRSYVDDLTKLRSDAQGVSQLTGMPVAASMDGATYQTARQGLREKSDSLMKSDVFSGRALKGLRNALDEAMGRSVSPADAAKWKDLNRQYANLKTIDKAMEGAGADVAAGKITPARLQAATRQQPQGDLSELARASGAFMKPLPDSGTAQRAMWTSALTGGAGLTAGAGSPALAAALVAMPPTLQKTLQSGAVKTWLTRQRAQGGDMTALVAALLAERTPKLLEPSR